MIPSVCVVRHWPTPVELPYHNSVAPQPYIPHTAMPLYPFVFVIVPAFPKIHTIFYRVMRHWDWICVY
eukprot:scaffold5439_cov69-Cyclotella_meneghiniana.AAC.2